MQNEPDKFLRELLTKKPFYRINADCGASAVVPRFGIGEQSVPFDTLGYDIVTQESFLRELDPNSHAINDRNLYKTFIQNDEDGLYYESDWERHAFAFQQEILEDRLVRLTGNDIQFDLSGRNEDPIARETYDDFKMGWANKSMDRAWYELVKSVLATGDAAFVGFLNKGKFSWRVLSFMKGDILYPHYDLRTGELNVFARTYTSYASNGTIQRYIDVWDDTYYYRFSDSGEDFEPDKKIAAVKDFSVEGYKLDIFEKHGFDEIPVAYKRCDNGPCWSNSQNTIELYEAAFSRLAQSNTAFGLPILSLTSDSGRGIQEITTSDLSYAAKIFVVPSDGKAEFLQRQDASSAYKAELDELKRKIYEQSMVVKAPELKSGDTPAAAIKLLYSDSYNKGMNETMEFNEVLTNIIRIFRWGYGIEAEERLRFIDLPISHYIIVYIPVSENELTTILATGVQNGFCSKQTAAEKFPYATPQEYSRITTEKHEDQMHDLLLQEQRLEIQNSATVEMQEEIAEINAEQQVSVAAAQAKIEEGQTSEPKARKISKIRKGSGSSGRKRGRPNMTGKQWDDNGNEIDPLTGRAKSKWDTWNAMH